MVIGVDIDGVLANFTDAYAKLLTAQTGIQFPKASEDWPPVWNWDRAAGVISSHEQIVWAKIRLKATQFWRGLSPLEGAVAAIRRLDYLSKHGSDVYFLTHRMGEEAKLQTERWLYDHGMDFPTVLLAERKLPILLALEVGCFIDDKVSTVEEVAGQIPNTYLKDAPYNLECSAGIRVTGAKEMLELEGLWSSR